MLLLPALAIIAFAASFHLHWALGGRLSLSVSLPQRSDGTPVMAHRLPWWRPAAGAVALGLVALALLLLAYAGHLPLPLPPELVRAALLATGAAFVARALVPNRYVGFFKSLRGTRWARYDTRLYSPLFLLLGLLLLAQALAQTLER
jgi:phosphoglycerol transferase MdoB-like AlkP superfamily enzyme